MNTTNSNCVYDKLNTNTFLHICLTFFPGAAIFYTLFWCFKLTYAFKQCPTTEQYHGEAKIYLIVLISSIVTMLLLPYIGLGDFFGPFTFLVWMALFVLYALWVFETRAVMRLYNAEKYNINYTSNLFLTLLFPSIGFFLAIKYVPEMVRLKEIKET